MVEVEDEVRSEFDNKIVDAIHHSESGKATMQGLVQDTGIPEHVLYSHLGTMKSRGILTSYVCELNDETYYKLGNG